MRQFVVIHAENTAIYARAVERMKVLGWRFESREKYNDAGIPTGEMMQMAAEPCYWVVVDDAWVVWQWEPGEPPHPAWPATQERVSYLPRPL